MSYNGSGVFNINTAGQPVVTGTVISSTAFNALTSDLGTGLSTAITKDGQTTATARIPFAAGINSSLVTDATSTTTGSIITAGGVGIAKALFVGTTANIAGTTTLAGVTATSITVAAGSAALPAIVSTTGTADTGLWFPAADTIAASTAGVERMRLDSSGNLLVGTTSQIADEKFGVLNAANTAIGVFSSSIASYTNIGLQVRIVDGSTSGSKYYAISTYAGSTPAYRFIVADSGTVTNSTGTYGTISDVKLKENIVDATPKLADLMKLQVRNFNLKSDLSEKHIGFIAQEMETVFPAMVESHFDRDSDGNATNEITKTVKTSILVPMLVKAIQEQQAIITALTTRITALEAK